MSRVRHAAVVPVASPISYAVYGLTLRSNVCLPALMPAPQANAGDPGGIQFSLCHKRFTAPFRQIMSWTLPTGEPWLICAKCEGGYVLRFADLADFCLDQLGRQITCHPISELSPETLGHLLLDHVLPLALNRGGQHALHATAVLTPYGVCAFTGATGMGKSTLAASFYRAGCAILSDDCLVLNQRQSALLATPAYPGLRLWGDSLAVLGMAHGPTQPVAHYTTKQRLITSHQIDHLPATSRHVVAIYSLIRQPVKSSHPYPSVHSRRLPRRAALLALLPHVFRMDITDRDMLIRQLDFLEHVVTQVPIYSLHFPSSFDALEPLRETILTDLRQAP